MQDLAFSTYFTISFLPAIFLLYAPFHKVLTRRQKVWLFILIGVIACVYTVTTMFFIKSYGWNLTYVKLSSAILFCILVLPFLAILSSRVCEVLFNFGLVGILMLCVASYSSFVMERIIPGDSGVIHGILYYVTFFVLCYPMRLIIKSSLEPFLRSYNEEYWGNIWFVPVALMGACAGMVPLDSATTSLYEVLGRTLVAVASVFMCRSIAYDFQQKQKKHATELNLVTQQEYYRALSRRVTNERKARHDFRHEVMAVRTYVENDDKQGLAAYCDKLLQVCGLGADIPFTGNQVADGIFYRYSTLANEKNIRFQVEGAIATDIVEDMDLCVLLGNTLENAVEACEKLNEGRFIRVEIDNRPELLSITVCNSYDGEVKRDKGVLLSRKREHEAGIGLASVREICEKYNGTMQYYDEKDQFAVIMLLNLQGIKKGAENKKV